MFNLDRDMKIDRIIDYIADLKERQEQLEESIDDLSERVIMLEEQVLTLTGGQKDN